MDIKVFYTNDNREFSGDVISETEDTLVIGKLLMPMMTGQMDPNGNPMVSLMPYALMNAKIELPFKKSEFRHYHDAPGHLMAHYQQNFGKIQLPSATDLGDLKL